MGIDPVPQRAEDLDPGSAFIAYGSSPLQGTLSRPGAVIQLDVNLGHKVQTPVSLGMEGLSASRCSITMECDGISYNLWLEEMHEKSFRTPGA